MRKNLFSFSYVMAIGVLILSACNLPDKIATAEVSSPTEQPPATATATVELTSTQMQVSLTQTLTVTATETPLPEQSPTLTPEIPIAEVARETNCRVGPAGNYDLVARYQVGQKLEIVAKDLGAGYWFVK